MSCLFFNFCKENIKNAIIITFFAENKWVSLVGRKSPHTVELIVLVYKKIFILFLELYLHQITYTSKDTKKTRPDWMFFQQNALFLIKIRFCEKLDQLWDVVDQGLATQLMNGPQIGGPKSLWAANIIVVKFLNTNKIFIFNILKWYHECSFFNLNFKI